MRILNQVVICSVVAGTLVYVLYRRRRRRNYGPSVEESGLEEKYDSSASYDLLFYLPGTEDPPEFTECIEFTKPLISTIAKVTLCANVCLVNSTDSLAPPDLDFSTVEPVSKTGTEMSLLELETAIEASVATFDRSSLSSGSGSEHALTPESSVSVSSPEIPSRIKLPPGCFNDPMNDIYEGNPEELNGTIIPKVLIPSDMWAEAVDQDIWHETFCVPAHMGGVLIGRLGKNVRELKNIWQAEFSLNTCPGRQDTLIFRLSCPVKHKDDVLRWVARRFRMRPSKTPIGNPNQLKRYLPLGEPVPVHVRSLYASKEFFVTIQDDEYSRYLKLQAELDSDYNTVNNFRVQLCEPVTSGTVAVVPHSQGFARALIISVHSTWPKTVFYFLLDHGTFGVVALNKLRKIRAKYMRTPFQAIHVSWAHAFPVFSDVPDIHILRTFFASGQIHASAVRMETCCRASVAFGEPYPPPYSTSGLLDILVNACNSGLYMAIPLALYPNRQSWLNGTNIPYYPFTYSAIDYPALVSFIAEASSPTPEEQYSAKASCPGVHSLANPVQFSTDSSNHGPINRNRSSRGGAPRRPFVWNPRYVGLGRGAHQRSPAVSQKENQNLHQKPEKTESKLVPSETHELVNSSEPKRKPLGVRNVRGSVQAVGHRGSARGRGGARFRD